MKQGWPSWNRLRRGSTGPIKENQLTIRLAGHLKDEAAKLSLPEDPAVIIQSVRASASGLEDYAEMWERIEEALITLIYGSNRIEDAGSSFDITVKLCRDVFRDAKVDAAIQQRDPEYEAHVKYLTLSKAQANQTDIIRSRREIIQHAQALNFIIDRIVLESQEWTEDLILQTHRILYEGLHDDIKAGEYRDHEVAARYVDPNIKDPKMAIKTSRFIRQSAVAEYMAAFIKNLNEEIRTAEQTKTMDPYSLAAKYHHHFVNIHPFGDGNGRMSRIILNVLLLKYAGHISAFGGEDEEKDAYIGIASRASKKYHQEDGEVGIDEQKGHHELARFVLTKSKSRLEDLWRWVKKAGQSKQT